MVELEGLNALIARVLAGSNLRRQRGGGAFHAAPPRAISGLGAARCSWAGAPAGSAGRAVPRGAPHGWSGAPGSWRGRSPGCRRRRLETGHDGAHRPSPRTTTRRQSPIRAGTRRGSGRSANQPGTGMLRASSLWGGGFNVLRFASARPSRQSDRLLRPAYAAERRQLAGSPADERPQFLRCGWVIRPTATRYARGFRFVAEAPGGRHV